MCYRDPAPKNRHKQMSFALNNRRGSGSPSSIKRRIRTGSHDLDDELAAFHGSAARARLDVEQQQQASLVAPASLHEPTYIPVGGEPIAPRRLRRGSIPIGRLCVALCVALLLVYVLRRGGTDAPLSSAQTESRTELLYEYAETDVRTDVCALNAASCWPSTTLGEHSPLDEIANLRDSEPTRRNSADLELPLASAWWGLPTAVDAERPYRVLHNDMCARRTTNNVRDFEKQLDALLQLMGFVEPGAIVPFTLVSAQNVAYVHHHIAMGDQVMNGHEHFDAFLYVALDDEALRALCTLDAFFVVRKPTAFGSAALEQLSATVKYEVAQQLVKRKLSFLYADLSVVWFAHPRHVTYEARTADFVVATRPATILGAEYRKPGTVVASSHVMIGHPSIPMGRFLNQMLQNRVTHWDETETRVLACLLGQAHTFQQNTDVEALVRGIACPNVRTRHERRSFSYFLLPRHTVVLQAAPIVTRATMALALLDDDDRLETDAPVVSNALVLQQMGLWFDDRHYGSKRAYVMFSDVHARGIDLQSGGADILLLMAQLAICTNRTLIVPDLYVRENGARIYAWELLDLHTLPVSVRTSSFPQHTHLSATALAKRHTAVVASHGIGVGQRHAYKWLITKSEPSVLDVCAAVTHSEASRNAKLLVVDGIEQLRQWRLKPKLAEADNAEQRAQFEKDVSQRVTDVTHRCDMLKRSTADAVASVSLYPRADWACRQYTP